MLSREKVSAVTLSILLIVSVIGPTIAFSTQPAAADASQDGEVAVAIPDNASSLDLRIRTHRHLRSTSLPGEANQTARLLDDLNGTFSGYATPNRSTDPTFGTDQRIAAAIQSHNTTIPALLAASDGRLARTALQDARDARDTLKERNVSFDESTVERELSLAADAHRQGDQFRDRDPTTAIRHYDRAWHHAQAALDVLDEAVDPTVTITNRSDPLRNGSANYTVRGTVFDVRPFELNITVSVDGDQRANVSMETVEMAPTGERKFAVPVTLDAAPSEVTVTAVDPNERIGERGGNDTTASTSGNDSTATPHNASSSQAATSPAPSVGNATLALDGDGLPDEYERTITGTDPLDADSNATKTAADESDNGVFDGQEDFDDDGLISMAEQDFGTDPLLADTDGDDLSDEFELQYRGLDPLDPNTDSGADDTKDGGEPQLSISSTDNDDGETDFDDDGLTNSEEEEIGTHPRVADTDGDGPNDGYENDSSIDPLDWDTDGDGLLDGEELKLEIDPNDSDTNGNGIEDGNETYTSTVEHASANVTVAVTGEGYVAKNVSIRAVKVRPEEEYNHSSIVAISNRSAFDQADVQFSIPDNVSSNVRDNLSITAWDPATNESFQTVPTTIDAQNGTATATVTSFSHFALATPEERNLGVTVEPGWPSYDPFVDNSAGWLTDNNATIGDGLLTVDSPATADVMLVADTSNATNDPDLQTLKDAAGRILDAMPPDDRVGLVSYASGATKTEVLTTNHSAVNDSIHDLDATILSETRAGDGLQVALDELAANGTAERAPAVVMLSRSANDTDPGPRAVARNVSDPDIEIHTVGVGVENATHEDTLEAVAQETDGEYLTLADNGTIDWKKQRHTKRVNDLVVSGTSVVTVSKDTTVKATNRSTTLRDWNYTNYSKPVWEAAAANDRVYTGGDDEVVVALDDSGTEIWTHTNYSAPIREVNVDGDSVSTSATDGKGVVLNTSGGEEAIYQLDDPLADDEVGRFNRSNESHEWVHSYHTATVWGVLRVGDVVYSVGADEQLIAANHTNGNLSWSTTYAGAGAIYSIDSADGYLYLGLDNGSILKVEAWTEGSVAVQYDVNASVRTLDVRNDVIYAGTGSGEVLAIDTASETNDIRSMSDGEATQVVERVRAIQGTTPSSLGGNLVDLPPDPGTARIKAQLLGTAVDGAAKLVADPVDDSLSPITVAQVTSGPNESTQSVGPGVVTANLTAFAGKTVQIFARTEGNASLQVNAIRLRQDTDGDGLSDLVEKVDQHKVDPNASLRMPILRNQSIDGELLDPDDSDSDDDDLRDGRELNRSATVDPQTLGADTKTLRLRVPSALSNPTDPNTDDDFTELPTSENDVGRRLNDSEEVKGWKVNVTSESNPFGWDNDSSATMNVTSNPRVRHSDEDGVEDVIERYVLHTDPRAERTYDATRFRQQYAVDDLAENGNYSLARKLHVIESHEGRADLHEKRLTDATDAFDFGVRAPEETWFYLDLYRSNAERFTFTALDGADRPDTWVSNQQELALVTESGIDPAPDPWDPDTDDDGLTDGQEHYWITAWNASLGQLVWDIGVPGGTTVSDPVNPDTDDDGYWDGWLGVHGVGRTANVVLYREHLQSGDGVNGSERVYEQIGYHQVGGSTPGADIDGDGTREHANIHVGERHWGTAPKEHLSTPDPSISVEIDYYEHSDSALDNSSWRESIVDNYALYGINVSLAGSQNTNRNITDQNLNNMSISSPFSTDNITTIEQTFNDTDALYMFVADDRNDSTAWGSRLRTHWDNTYWTALFTDNFLSFIVPDRPYTSHLSHDENMSALGTKVAVHEIGHVLNLGENDDWDTDVDGDIDEVYSGSDNDSTHEIVYDNSSGFEYMNEWSVMAPVNDELFARPSMHRYVPISIEELLTVSLIDVEENNYD